MFVLRSLPVSLLGGLPCESVEREAENEGQMESAADPCCHYPSPQHDHQPNPQELEGAMWDGLPKSQATTVEGMFKACSFGLADVSKKAGGALLRVAVPIPCSGVTPQGAGYSSSSCPFNGERQPLA